MNRQATARMITQRVRTAATMLPTGIAMQAGMTDLRNIYKSIRVAPETPQTVQWLTPGNAIEYTIVTNLDWQII